MRTVLLLVCFILLGATTAKSQKKKKLSKKERREQHYNVRKKAVIDTSFTFITREITSPFLSSNKTGGYLHINSKELRIQEIDWVESSTNIKRLRDLVELKNFRIQNGSEPESILINFSGQLQGTTYFFTIFYGLEKKPELLIKNDKNQTTRYVGTVKLN